MENSEENPGDAEEDANDNPLAGCLDDSVGPSGSQASDEKHQSTLSMFKRRKLRKISPTLSFPLRMLIILKNFL